MQKFKLNKFLLKNKFQTGLKLIQNSKQQGLKLHISSYIEIGVLASFSGAFEGNM